jgi:hypothetical protein
MKVNGLTSVKQAMQTHMREMQAAMVEATTDAAELLLNEMEFLTDRIDHDLQQLREMGHPYAARNPQGQPHPDWIVHIQSGDLQRGLKLLPTRITGGLIEADILSEAPYTWHLLLGTRLMRSRDFVSAAIINRTMEVEAIYQRAFLEQLDIKAPGAFRTQVNLIPHPDRPAQLPGR